ncbi:hypothetical protein CISG_04685 [Coccidioides immitis RMSCC 3703]|uniref:Uncharacterized protein n=1 Tax=Coccidioides immitis RMSCC 3703 TaxID=454286 RepID=A0A0J8QQ78_COCIT|nr:hypothetical protein CISG_04685 [Coccidioides immitis RMSCC 3703]
MVGNGASTGKRANGGVVGDVEVRRGPHAKPSPGANCGRIGRPALKTRLLSPWHERSLAAQSAPGLMLRQQATVVSPANGERLNDDDSAGGETGLVTTNTARPVLKDVIGQDSLC